MCCYNILHTIYRNSGSMISVFTCVKAWIGFDLSCIEVLLFHHYNAVF